MLLLGNPAPDQKWRSTSVEVRAMHTLQGGKALHDKADGVCILAVFMLGELLGTVLQPR